MRYKKTKPRVVEQSEVHSSTVCDFCGAKRDEERERWDNEKADYFERSEVELSAKLGEIYPEGDSRQGEYFDCCPSCWRTTIRPALEKMMRAGAKMTRTRWEGPYPSTSDYEPET